MPRVTVPVTVGVAVRVAVHVTAVTVASGVGGRLAAVARLATVSVVRALRLLALF